MNKLASTLSKIEPIELDLEKQTRRRLDRLTMPQGSLGRLEELAQRAVAITKNPHPHFTHKVIITMAGDHGVVEEGVSAFPKEVTVQMVVNFLQGGAGINVLSRHVGARVQVVDMGVAVDLDSDPSLMVKKVGYGTKNFTKGPAMTKEEATRAIEAGIEVVEEMAKVGLDILGTGDMGIANTTASSAITACITGLPVSSVAGRGTGITDEILQKKIWAIERGLAVNKPNPEEPLDVLAKVGGFEIGGIVGAILAGAMMKIPVVIDGFISGASALIAVGLAPLCRDYIIAAHRSEEAGHGAILERLRLQPLLDLRMRLGEGTGAALGINLMEAGIKILKEMASFEDAGVSEGLI